MPITYDIQQDGLYKQGVERGVEKGIEKGIEKVTIRCLEEGMTYPAISAITRLSIQQIEKLDKNRNQ